MLALASSAKAKGWRIGALDIKTAFLHAELCDEEDGIILVVPPVVLVRQGLVAPDEVWKLTKVLYGLMSGPKKWNKHRDQELLGLKVQYKGQEARLSQSKFCGNIWLAKTKKGEIVG